jgi:hypothetical protein
MPTPDKFFVSETDVEPIAVTIEQAARLSGESRSQVYNRLGHGQYQGLKSGRRTLVLVASIKQFLESLPPAVIKPPKPRPPRAVPQAPRRGRKPKAAASTSSES